MIANRGRVDSKVGEVWRVDAATGAATKLIGKADTVYSAADATADGGRSRSPPTSGTGQLHAGIYDVAREELELAQADAVGADRGDVHARRRGADRRAPTTTRARTL